MKLNKLFAAIALCAAIVPPLTSCSADEPFNQEGQGTLRIKMVVNSEVTRAETNEQELRDKCIVYISDAKGLLHKWKGLDNMPSTVALYSGHYVAEAWTGDSVSADFEKKFYKGIQPFDIAKGDVQTVVLNCRIANVVASINPEETVQSKMKNWTVNVKHTRGSLDFTADNFASAHGYFMMPNNDNKLVWTVSGENEDGKPFTKTGEILNVKPAHEYVLNLSYNPNVTPDDTGGGFITVTVNDNELLIEEEITIHSAPVFDPQGFDISAPLSQPMHSFTEKVIKVYASQGFKSFTFSVPDYAAFGLPTDRFDLCNMTPEAAAAVRAAGLNWSFMEKPALEQTNAVITFSAALFNHISANGEYPITMTAVDLSGRTREVVWGVNVTDAAVENEPVDPTAVHSYTATLSGVLIKPEFTNPGFEYRKKGDAAWQFIAGEFTRASQRFTAVLSGLTPGATYEYRAVADGYKTPVALEFTTEAVFVIPNNSFEQWAYKGEILIPGPTSNPTFWDTGNHGAMSMKASLGVGENITHPTTSIFHTGTQAAELVSQFIGLGSLGKLAAGNIFTGTYDKTSGTNGELTFGRPFNGTHPVKLRVWVNYRPGTVDKYSGAHLNAGDIDQAQIYVALADRTFSIKTATKQFFDSNAEGILAYGEHTMTGNVGADGQLQMIEIPIAPRAGFLTAKPSVIVIVASASKYGDYFEGANSTLIIDDVELVYE